MRTHTDGFESSAEATPSAIDVTIVYEDRESGIRAKDFAEQLADQLGCSSKISESIWRSDLLEAWPIAHAATNAAMESDYFIVAVRGELPFPQSAQLWIEAQLDAASKRGAVLIFLSHPDREQRQEVERTREQLRSACDTKGVTFFSHTVTAPAEERLSNDHETLAPVCSESSREVAPLKA